MHFLGMNQIDGGLVVCRQLGELFIFVFHTSDKKHRNLEFSFICELAGPGPVQPVLGADIISGPASRQATETSGPNLNAETVLKVKDRFCKVTISLFGIKAAQKSLFLSDIYASDGYSL